ncbi:MFS transporter [Saccharomonospora halophila]|uniref:MFS transporter n=1 Tax=Saccharomonospora halophila TaxID=129922 RepID=UPI000378A938|nr:MFS transporter [Saccharomonospora halophila]
MAHLLLRFSRDPVTVVGVVLAVGGSVVGFFRAFPPEGGPLHGMPLSSMPEMFVAGAGIAVALVGMLLRAHARRGAPRVTATPASAVPGRRRRWLVAGVATGALTIDVSKTSTLGFVIPGMSVEYGLAPAEASMLAVAGLSGTAIGAVCVGRLADRIGRRACYLITTLGFTATSMCATMPTFLGNVVMCLLMGVAVGGLAPLLIATLVDVSPGSARGSTVIALSVVATAVGYLVAAGSALWLEPAFGWRILWLTGAPTGLLLALATVVIPERRVPRDGGGEAAVAPERSGTVPADAHRTARLAFTLRLQALYAATIGVLTFGLNTWIPTLARAGGLPVTTANTLLTVVAVVMVPCAILVAVCYRRVGPIRLAVLLATGTAVVLLALAASGLASAVAWLSAAVLAAALFAVNTMAAIFLPIAADLADAASRERVTGGVSFFNRLGGLTGPLVLSSIVASTTDVLIAVAVLALCCGAIAWYTGRRHRSVSTAAPEPVGTETVTERP